MLTTAQPRILLVDDDPAVCRVLAQGLMHSSPRQPLSVAAAVASAHSVASALELLTGKQDSASPAWDVVVPAWDVVVPAWDVVVVDVGLGDRSGLDLLQEMRTHSSERAATMGWILLTGRVSPEQCSQAISLRVDDVLMKPVSLARLREVVLQCFAKACERRSRATSAAAETIERRSRANRARQQGQSSAPAETIERRELEATLTVAGR